MRQYTQQEIFTNNLKRLLDEHNYKQIEVAEAIGTTPQTFNTWIQGKSIPRMDKIQKLAEFFGVYKSELVDQMSYVPKTVAVVGSVRAGVPLEAAENIIGYEEISPKLLGDYFALKVKGDSMSPRIAAGDIVIVRRQSTVESGQVAIVLVNGNEATIKKVIITESGITLMPFNPLYEPIVYSRADCKSLPVQIIGKVVELRAAL